MRCASNSIALQTIPKKFSCFSSPHTARSKASVLLCAVGLSFVLGYATLADKYSVKKAHFVFGSELALGSFAHLWRSSSAEEQFVDVLLCDWKAYGVA
jgi:hypothetical protein